MRQNRKFDVRRTYTDISAINQISVNASAVKYVSVIISASNNPTIDIHFSGKATIDGTIKLAIELQDANLKITLKNKGHCYHYTYLSIDITVPQDKLFNLISVKNSANIRLDKYVSANCIKLHSQSGNIKNSANFTTAEIFAENGNIDMAVHARQGFSAKLITIFGNVNLKLKNIGYLNLCGRSTKILNYFNETHVGFVADVFYSITSGLIEISNFEDF